MALDREQKIVICAIRRYAKTTGGFRYDGSTHCLKRRTVRKLAMRNSTVKPTELSSAERALIRKGLLVVQRTNGHQCVILKGGAAVIKCSNVLRKRYSRRRRRT